jgi:hypothetical protein
MKDGPEGDMIASRLEQEEVGTDEDGDPITSCVIVPVEISETRTAQGPRLTKNQQTMFSILHDAGCLSKEQWNERARDAGLGTSRKADLHDLRTALLHNTSYTRPTELSGLDSREEEVTTGYVRTGSYRTP